MGRQSYFGEYEVIFPHPRSGGVRALHNLLCYLLPRNNFVDIVNEVSDRSAPFPVIELFDPMSCVIGIPTHPRARRPR